VTGPYDALRASGSSLLEVTDLTVTFPTDADAVAAVRGLSYRVEAGEVVAIVGESGSGKSAAAMAVIGLLPEYAEVSGSVRLHGDELLDLSDKRMSQIRGKAIGTVFQDPMSALTPVYTIGDQIAEAIKVHQPGTTRRAARARALALLDLVGIAQPERRVRAFPHELSGGERQRVVIAIAIANDPDLLICDEPTTALDVTVQAQILDVLRTARDVTGAGVVIITHDLGIVAEFADRAVVMYAGRAVETADIETLYRDRRMPYTAGLLGSVPRLDAPQGARLVPIPGAQPSLSTQDAGACPFAPRCPLAIVECVAAEPELITVGPAHEAACIRTELVAGRSAAQIYGVHTEPPQGDNAAAESPVVVRVTDLVKTYPLTKGVVFRQHIGEVRAVNGVSFELRQGRTLGIVGESGSGKSTTLHEIFELAPPQSGSIEVLGTNVAGLDARARRALRSDLQVVFQDPVASLDPRLPVSDVIAEPLLANGFDKQQADERVAELLDIVGLRRADATRYPAEFSGGQKQRIGIARALALRPKILALDEPVSALDVSIQAGIINLVLDLQERFGLSYLFVSHDLSVIKHLSHDVAVMYKGEIVEQGEAERVFTDPQHDYTRRLLKAVPQPLPDVAGSAATEQPPPPAVSAAPPPQKPAATPPAPPPQRDRSGRRAALRIAAALTVIVLLVSVGVLAIRFGTGRHTATATGAAELGTTNDINPQNPATLLDGGTLRLALSEYPVNFNPLHIDGNTGDAEAIIKPTMPRAFIIKPDGSTTLNTDYFTKVELTKTNPQVVTYTINPKAVWSDGTPITWEDIAAQIHALRGKDPAYKIASPNGAERVASVTRGVDDRQAVVTFEKPYAEWQGMFAGNSVLLPHTMTATPEAFNTAQLNGPGPSAGPFIVTTLDKGAQRITLTRNPAWWGQRPRLDAITLLVLDAAADIPALQNNAIDAVGIPSLDDLTIARRTAGISIRHAPGNSWTHFTFNGAQGSILADERLRLAIMKGIDRQAIANVIQRGLVSEPKPLNNHIYVAGQEGYQDNSKPAAFNPDEARRDLDALGWKLDGPFRRKDGRTLAIRLVIFEAQSGRQIAQVAQNSLAQIGVRLDIDVKSGGRFFTDYIIPGDFDIALFGWVGDAYPLSGLTQIYKSDGESNFGKIGSPQIDAKIEQTLAELDAGAARRVANELDLLIWQEGFSLPLLQSPGNVAVRSTLANFGAAGLGDYNWSAIGFMK
jgi:peptide/nickel transport system ATP-binding protein